MPRFQSRKSRILSENKGFNLEKGFTVQHYDFFCIDLGKSQKSSFVVAWPLKCKGLATKEK